MQEMKKLKSSLNGDIMFDILSRLQVKPLLGMKRVSRGWRAMISSFPFIKSQMEKTGLSLTGFIFQEKFQWCSDDIKTVSHIALDSQSSKKVLHNVFDFLPEYVVILASCDGLVCCRSCFPCSDPSVYLCNPSNKEWIRIQWPWHKLKPSRNESIGIAFDFESDSRKECNEIFVKFKLVKLQFCLDEYEDEDEDDDEEWYIEFHVYSSETKEWKVSSEVCHCDHNLIKNKGVHIGGVLHWLTDGDQVLSFDVEKELALLISVPVPAFEFSTVPEACIGDHNGKLHYVLVSEIGLHVWYLEDYYEFKWTLKHFKDLDEIEREYPQFFLNLKNHVSQRVSMESSPWMNPLGFKDGVLLLKVCATLYLYDIENNKISLACYVQDLSSKSMHDPTVFPHCLSLFPLKLA
ncbi:putative F-box protein At3g23950 [Arachis stenosperma]|uniref:putative F-box protein At3g23950 n=1 Tax=Arachis stenosperma TaxID=217475 RepID=UPI0025AB875C|nr:putative F-box protein At3g23950 [Arachis stenosperma]